MEREVHEAGKGYTDGPFVPFLELPADERPRERLVKHGPEALSDQELLAILLNTGVRGKNVTVLADEVLERLEQNRRVPTIG
jgi:DNA repair protein RadC